MRSPRSGLSVARVCGSGSTRLVLQMAAEEGSPAESPASGAQEEESGCDSKCIFCRISRRQEPGAELLHCQDEDLVCFKDIRPGAPHHYLVVPKKHIGNCKTLTKDHIPLVKQMVEVGKTILLRNHFTDLEDTRVGFHWAPFCTIAHLHLHVLAPASQLGFLSRMIYRINSYWFITADQLIERLQTENPTS